MARGDALGADLAGQGDKPLELDFRVAQAAGNGCFPCLVALDKRPDHRRLKFLFEVNHVVGDTQEMRHGAGIIDIIKRTAAAAGVARRVQHAFQALQARQTALVPQLHRQPDHRGGLACAPRRTLESELFSTSKAAAVELSTPPLIATAMVMTGKPRLGNRNSKLEIRSSRMEIGNWKS